jgi:hypothetical protein
MKLKEALANGLSGIMEGDGSNQIVAAAGKMAELGRRMYEEFSKAASGMSQDTDKAGQALGQAISTASSALGTLIGMLPKLWEFLKSDAWAEMSAVPGQVVSAAAKIIQIGAAIAQAFMGAMGNVSDEAAKSAQNGAAVVGAASQALTALVGMLPKLWEFINDPAFDEIMAAKGQVVAAARKIIQLGKQIADAFLGAMGSVSDDTAKAAQNGAAVIGATTQSVSGLIDTIKKIVDFTSDVGYAAALFSSEGRANILRAADMIIQLGSVMLDMFVAAAGHVTQKATLAAKRFGEGLQSMGQGLTSVVDLITKLSGFLQDGMNAVFSVSPLMQTNLVGLATLMANLGAAMLNSFAQAGSQVSSLTVAAAKRLAEGIQAAASGITSVVDLVVKLGSFIQDGMNAVFSTSDAMQRNVIELARRLSVMALAIYANWVDAAATVAQIHVEAAKRLSDGVKAAVDGLTGALTFITHAMEAMQDTALNATIAPGAAQAALVQFAQNLAQLARQIYNKWIDVAATVAQQHVDAAKKLSEGVLAGVSAITATLEFAERALEAMQYKALAAVVEPGKARDALLVFAENLSRLARDIYDNWVTVSATVSQQHVEAAKRLSEGVQAAISAVTGTMGVVVALLTFASNSVYRAIVQSEGARAYFAAFAASIMKLGAAIVAEFTKANIAIDTPVVNATKRFADAVSNVMAGLSSTIALVNTLVTLLQRGMPQVDATDLAARFVGPLVRIGVTLSTAANAAAQSLTGLDTTGLDKLKNVIGGLLDVFKGIADLVDYILGGEIPATLARIQATIDQVQQTLANVGVQMTVSPDALFHAILDPILAIGVTLTRVIAQGTDALSGLDTSGYDKLASVMGNAQETIQKIIDLSDFILDMFANGGLFDAATRIQTILNDLNARLASMGVGQASLRDLLHAMLDPILNLGVALAQVAADATAVIADLNLGGLTKLNEAVGGLQTALQTIPRLVYQIIGMMHASLPTVDPQQVTTNLFNPLFALAINLVKAANTAAAGIKDVAIDALTKLGEAVGKLSDVLQTTLNLVATLGGKLPPLDDAAMTVIEQHLVAVLNAGKRLADKAYEVAKDWMVQVPLAFENLGTSLQSTLDIIGKTLDIVTTLGGDKFPAVTGSALDLILSRLVDVLTAGKKIADKALEVARDWTATVNPVMASVAGILSTSLDLISKTLDIVGALGGEKFPPLTGAALDLILSRLGDVLTAGKKISEKATSVATEWTATVNPVMDAVGKILASGLDIVSKTLDIVGQLGGEKFPPLTGDALARILVRLEDVLAAGKAISQVATTVASEWKATVNPVMDAVGKILASGLDIVSKTLNIVGQLSGDKFPSLTGDALARILVRLEDTLTAGKAIARVATDTAREWQATVNPVMDTVGKILASSLEIISKTLDIVGQLNGDKFPKLTGDALARILVRLEDTLTAGKAIAATATRVATSWTATVNPVMTAVGTILAASLDIISKTLDIVGQLGGEKFPDVTGAALSTILTRLENTLKAGKDIADRAIAVATGWQITVNPAMTTVGTILASSLDIITKTLDIVSALGGEKFPPMDSAALAPVLTRLDAVLRAGYDLATRAVSVATGWSVTVPPAMTAVAKVLTESLDIIGKTLDIVGDLGGEKFPPFDDAMMTPLLDRLASVLDAGKQLAYRAAEVARNWSLTVNPAMETVGKALSEGIGIVKSVLEFNDLKAKLASFKPLDMNVFGPKIDQIFQAAKDLATQFVAKAQAAGITKAMQEAADALAKVFGDAANTIKGALDMSAQLLDPATVIPSIGQIDAKLTAVLTLIGEVTQRFAAKAESIGPDTTKSAEGLANAVKSVFDAIGQVIEAVKAAADLYTGTAGFNNITGLLTTLFDTFDQFAGRTAQVEGVTSAITTLLGGIQALTADAGTTAGTSWAQQFAAAITASAGTIQGAIRRAITLPTATPPPPSGGTGGNGGGTTINNTYDQRRTFNITVNNTTTDAAHTTWAGIGGLVGYS